jgi:diguanylate cyclase (GGDEF)-like protein
MCPFRLYFFKGGAYHSRMRNYILRALAALLASAVAVTLSFTSFPMRETYLWFEFFGLLLASLAIFVLMVFLQLVYAKPGVRLMLFIGLLVYQIGTLLDAIDEVLVVSRGFELAESIMLPVGLCLSIAGFFHLLRNQRRAQTVLEAHRSAFERLSITDELTGLYNSRHFYEQLQTEIRRVQRYGRELSVLLIDIDDFKKHNDSYGHIEGDKVLRALGKQITAVLRGNDSGYRYGGEEFTIILPETDEKQAIIVAERIRKDFKAMEFAPDSQVTRGGQRGAAPTQAALAAASVHKTLSTGVAQFSAKDEVTTLIKRADKAMYLAKQRGKDQTATYTAGDTDGELQQD